MITSTSLQNPGLLNFIDMTVDLPRIDEDQRLTIAHVIDGPESAVSHGQLWGCHHDVWPVLNSDKPGVRSEIYQ